MGLLTKVGYGQVEPNHLSAQRTAQIYAQLPLATELTSVQNGQFVKYAYADGEVNLDGDGEWMLVYNEVKVYDVRQTDANFIMDGLNGNKTPRVFKTNVGDIFTTNLIKTINADNSTIAVGAKLQVDTDGILLEIAVPVAGEMTWSVAKVYTLADGQKAVKLQRIV